MSEKAIFYWKSDKIIEKLVISLNKGEISIVSTDTVLGFLANVTNESFFNLNFIKGERVNKPYIILISCIEKLNNFINLEKLNKNILDFIKKIWPGPVTIIFKAKENLPDFLLSEDKKIAIRFPDHKELINLLENFDGLFSTSANKSGKKIPENINQIDLDILEKISYLVINSVDRNNLLTQTLPSTIIDVSDNNSIKVVREGFYNTKNLESLYGAKFIK